MKKCLCLVLALAMSASFMAIPASANSAPSSAQPSNTVTLNGFDITVDPEEEIQRAIAGITDLEIDSIAVNVDVSTLAADVVPSDENYSLVSTYATTREIQLPAAYSARNDESKVYATTGVAVLDSNEKSDSGSKNEEYVTAYATVYWRDNLGPSNDFLGASGGWKVDKNLETEKYPVLSNKSITLEWYNTARDSGREYFYPSGNTFYISESEFDYSAWSFTVYTFVTIDSGTRMRLDVTTGLFT